VPISVYIDGFNRYYGALKGSPYRWLDLAALCRRLLSRDDVKRIRQFSARVLPRPDDPGASQRQSVYLRALRTLPTAQTHLGEFRSHPARLALRNPFVEGPRTIDVVKTEERGSDADLAALLMLDACQRDGDTAVIVSSASNLQTPVRLARHQFGTTMGVVNPQPAQVPQSASRSGLLQAATTFGTSRLPAPARPPRRQRHLLEAR
jgi:hypothetical protein